MNCAVCNDVTDWEMWGAPFCGVCFTAWRDYEPRIDALELDAAQIQERSDKWVAWMKKKTPQKKTIEGT